MEPILIKTEKDATTILPGNTPAFLIKLRNLVDDQTYCDLISWSRDGTSFKVHDQAAFSKIVLPKYYKHNNFSSFIRQVNLYGFRKVLDLEQGGQWEFFHPSFQRSRPEDMCFIKRKPTKDVSRVNPSDISGLIQDVNLLKSQHNVMAEQIDVAKTDNEQLWQEIYYLRENHNRQQLIINKLIRFLLQLVMGNEVTSRKRRALDLNGNVNVVLPKVCRSSNDQPYRQDSSSAALKNEMFMIAPSEIISNDNARNVITEERILEESSPDFQITDTTPNVSGISNISSDYVSDCHDFSIDQTLTKDSIFNSTTDSTSRATHSENDMTVGSSMSQSKDCDTSQEDFSAQEFTVPLSNILSEKPLDFDKISNNLESLQDAFKNKQLKVDPESLFSLFAEASSFLNPQMLDMLPCPPLDEMVSPQKYDIDLEDMSCHINEDSD